MRKYIIWLLAVGILSIISIPIIKTFERTDNNGTATVHSSKVKEERVYPITLYYDIIVSQDKPKLVFIRTVPECTLQIYPIYFEEFKSDNGCEMLRVECEDISFIFHSHKCTNSKCIYPK